MPTERATKQKQRYKKNTGAELQLVDGRTFQAQIEAIAVTLANLIEREGHSVIRHPYLNADLTMLLKQVTYTYDLLFYVNADERREADPAYRQVYSFVILPLIRTMIDGFYNATSLLDDISRAAEFRASGYCQSLTALTEDQRRYGTDSRWLTHTKDQIEKLSLDWRASGFTDGEIQKASMWPTLSGYLRKSPKDTPHKKIVKSLAYGFWREYSAISHATFQGLMDIGPFLTRERVPHSIRQNVLDLGEYVITSHIGRAAGVLLCLVTELQAFYKFKGANLGERLHDAWNALIVMAEIRELYETRYRELMKARRITSDRELPEDVQRLLR